MTMNNKEKLSPELQKKIDSILSRNFEFSPLPFNARSPFFLAPLSGFTTRSYRALITKLGAGSCVTELTSAHALKYESERTLEMLTLHETEKWSGIQLFGSDPQIIAEATLVAEKFNPLFIDINMGCPVKKVVSKGAGSALLQDTSKLPNFFKTIRKAVTKVPLTIKIRLGWSEPTINAQEVINIAYNEGIDLVFLHGRTKNQFYTGKVNWDLIENLAQNFKGKIPLIGNGDLICDQTIAENFQKTNCAGFMIGRGALKDPFIFLKIIDRITSSNSSLTHFNPKDYLETVHLYDELIKDDLFGDNSELREKVHLIQLKKHIVSISSGLKDSTFFRNKVVRLDNYEEILTVTDEYFNHLNSDDNSVNFTVKLTE